jgi:hypothetical protein
LGKAFPFHRGLADLELEGTEPLRFACHIECHRPGLSHSTARSLSQYHATERMKHQQGIIIVQLGPLPRQPLHVARRTRESDMGAGRPRSVLPYHCTTHRPSSTYTARIVVRPESVVPLECSPKTARKGLMDTPWTAWSKNAAHSRSATHSSLASPQDTPAVGQPHH